MENKTKVKLIITTVIFWWLLLGFVSADFNLWNWFPIIRALYVIAIIITLNKLFENDN